MGVLERDPDETAATLTRWLEGRTGVEDPSVSSVSIPGATGWSNETILFDAAWRTEAGVRTSELVARIAPSDHRVFPDDTFFRQYTVMQALAERSEVPMARVHWLETDRSWFGQPFWIMDRVSGDIPADTPPYAGTGWLHDATPDRQQQAWFAGVEAMASVHRVDLEVLGLPAGTYPVAGPRQPHQPGPRRAGRRGVIHTEHRHHASAVRRSFLPPSLVATSGVSGSDRADV